ncbi:ABC transporter permease [Paenibacillus graminis]|uniref:ABC3 transporter permease C-terminal domain-containing protein n=1 Tax=Paenibacillus graminis TaxID=189425 RepID=A0A089MCI3_9BACL|nr:ABC transporter permease [Paenibacillus graminis]AIQ70982.1 hypothetical protein PGRAT_27745 [Paenibacillus graminis]
MRINQTAVIDKVSKRYYRANRTRNIVLACAIILSTVLITIACSTLYNYQQISTNQDLKEIGTNANVIISRPTQEQITLLENMDILQPKMNIQYVLGSLVGNQGQAGINVDMLSVTNWGKFSKPLMDHMWGTYPEGKDEIMMSTWLLSRLGYPKPKVGMEIRLSVAIKDIKIGGDAEVQTQPYILAGFYEDTANISSENKRIVYFSETFIDEYPQETPNLIGLHFKNTSHYQDKVNQVRSLIHLDKSQNLIPSYDGKLNMSIKDFFIAFFAVIFFMFDGYLIIYNVANISITQDVRFYGMLKTLGTTSKQIKRIVYFNALKTASVAIPVGILFGWGLSAYIVPLALSSFSRVSSIDAQFNSWILLAAFATSSMTLFISYRAPARKAGNISPIEALKFTPLEHGNYNSRSRQGAKIPYMALKNILRNKKRVFIVVLTLFLSSTMLLVLTTFLKSFSVEEYINAEVKYDIALYNHMTRASFSPTEEQHLTPELLTKISAVDGIRKTEKTTVVSIYQHYSDKNYSEWLRISNDFRKSMNEELRDKTLYEKNAKTQFWGLLIGIDDKKLEEYNQTTDNPIDLEAFSKGEIALVTDLNGNGISIGSKIPFTLIDQDKTFEVKIGGQITFERDAMNSGAAPWLIVSNNVINNYHPNSVIYSLKIDAQKGKEKDVLDAVTLLTSGDNSISRTSKIEQAKAFDDLKHSFSNFSIIVIIILGSIGILNFANTMLVSVMSRKQELAILESVGATKRQIKQLITYEGIWYALLSLALTLTVGSGINYLSFSTFRENMEYGVFSYPVLPLLLCEVIIFLLCGALPRLLYRLRSHESIVEQLREAG